MPEKPKNKLVKYVLCAAGGIAGLFVLLLILAAVIVPIVLSPTKLKAMATNDLPKIIHHQVSVGDIHFNVFTGFEIKDLKIANRAGWAPQPLLSASDIFISYHLLPLLWGQVSLGEIKLNQPDILVEKRPGGQFNFSDMTGSAPAAAPSPAAKPAAKAKAKPKGKKKPGKHVQLPLNQEPEPDGFYLFSSPAWADTGKTAPKIPDISIGSFNIINAKLVYLDETVNPSQKAAAQGLNLKVSNISLKGGKTTYSLSTPFTMNKLDYQLALSGSLHYFYDSQSIKGLDLKGTVNDLGFNFAGDILNLAGDITPTVDGEASLNMLKLAGLVPSTLAKMPSQLSLTGPAKVDFHLSGSKNSGLSLSGTADGSELAIKYSDLFVKTAKSACTVDFKTLNRMNQGEYDVNSFKVTYGEWEVTGAFHYKNGAPWTCEVHSKSIPFKGLPGMLPKLRATTIDGSGSVDLRIAGVPKGGLPFTVSGQIALKGVGVNLPKEPYIQALNGTIYVNDNLVRIPPASFQLADGTGALSVTFNGVTSAYSYGFNLKNVDAQKAVDASIDAYVVVKDYSSFKDMLYGTMNFAYSGSGKGTSGDAMLASQVGNGSYSLINAKIKAKQYLGAVNKYLKNKVDEMDMDKVEGILVMKEKVFTFTLNATGKAGAIREKGGIQLIQQVYSPDMEVQSDIKRDFVDSGAVQSNLPGGLSGLVKTPDFIVDDSGNVPLDFKFTGKVADNHYAWDPGRLVNVVKKHAGAAVQNAVKQGARNLGNQLKGLFH